MKSKQGKSSSARAVIAKVNIMKLSQLSARLSSAAALLAGALCPVWMPETIGQECACQTQVSPYSGTMFGRQVPFTGLTAPQVPAAQNYVAQGSRLPAGWPAQWGDPIVAVPRKANSQNQNLATRANGNEGLVRDPFTGQMVPTSLQARWDKVTTTRDTADATTIVKTNEETSSVLVAEKSSDNSATSEKAATSEKTGNADKSASGSSSKKAKSSGGGGGAPGGAFGAGVGMGGGGNGGGMGGGMAGGGNGGGGGGNGTNGINWNPQTGGAGNAGGGGGNNNERTANAVLNEKADPGTTTGGGTTDGGTTGGGTTGGGTTGGGTTGGGTTGGGTTGGGTNGGGSNGGGCLIDVNPPTPSVPPCDHSGHGGNGSSHGNGPSNGGNGNVPPGTGGTDPGSPVVPEPGTALLLGIGGAIAGVRYLRRRNATEPAAV